MNSSGASKSERHAEPPGPTVFVVDDDNDFSDALKWLLESDGLATETFPSASAFLSAYEQDRPGCVVLDVRMPGMNGLEAHEELSRRQARIPVIVTTAYGTMPTAVRAMKAGALDVLEKPVNDEVLLNRIREAIALDAECRTRDAKRQELRELVATLTPRERQVLDLIVEGKANKQIAFELGLSEKTVEVHRKRVMKKMRVRAVVDLVRTVLAAELNDEAT